MNTMDVLNGIGSATCKGECMQRTVATGIQDFEEIRKNNYFYIDKTAFIKEWWENGDNTTLITRPRRFGKTLNISMLEKFFSVDYAGRADLFEGLNIWQEEKYRKLQGTYPVISLSFARVKEDKLSDVKEKMREIIRNVYEQKRFLLESNLLTEQNIAYFNRVLSDEASEVDLTSSLHHLSDFLYRYYGNKVLIFLDEYDTPMQEAYVGGYWNELVMFTRNLFNSTFKTNQWLERAVMTGITRVSKESIFSDLNHLEVVTTTSDKYATAFGFTEDEVFATLREYDFPEDKETVKYWYDGFIFGMHKDIYNPWSVINLLDKGKLGIYWANTSGNGLISKLLKEGKGDIKVIFEGLLKVESFKTQLDEQVVYSQLDTNPYAIWSLLLASGYLKVVNCETIVRGYERDWVYELAITNYETRKMFEDMVKGWFGNVSYEYNGFIKAMLEDDLETMNDYLSDITSHTFSYFDVDCNEPEKFYHAFMLGLTVDLQREYIITSNRESGRGRYDVMLEPRDKSKTAFILEFKALNRRRENSLEETVQAALKQIEDKQYAAQLIGRGVPKKRIRSYGFAFWGKEVLIG